MLNFRKTIKNISSELAKIIFPKSCFICNQIISDGFFCVDDHKKIHFLQNPACDICFQPFVIESELARLCGRCLTKRPNYFKAISVIKYDENSKSLITKFKYSDRTYAAKYFANLMFNQSKEILSQIDFIAPVPLHKLRLIRRKFNQSALLANHLQKFSGIKTINDLLIRTRNTVHQSSLNKKSRAKNIASAFSLNKKYQQKIIGKNILLIDDVITTEATINACSKALLKGKVGKIYVLTLAKTILD